MNKPKRTDGRVVISRIHSNVGEEITVRISQNYRDEDGFKHYINTDMTLADFAKAATGLDAPGKISIWCRGDDA